MELQQLVVIFSWSTKYLLVLALQIWFDKTLNIFKFWTVGPIKQDIWNTSSAVGNDCTFGIFQYFLPMVYRPNG